MFCTIIKYPQFYLFRVYRGENVFIIWNIHSNCTEKTCNPGKSHRCIYSLNIHVTITYRRFILRNICITGCFSKLKSCQGCECRLLRAYEEIHHHTRVSVLGGTPCSLNDLPRGPDDAAWAWATRQSVTTRSRIDRETTA